MKKEEFVNICRAVEAGRSRRVKHMVTNEEGQVIACGTEEAVVEVELDNGERKSWATDDISVLELS